jgi:hypothetical protein
MIVTPDMLKAFLERMQYNRHRKVSYKYALDVAVAAAVFHGPLNLGDLEDLKAALVAECVMSHLYDFASSYNSESISNPVLYAKKLDAIKEALAQLARGTFSLYDNTYQDILFEQYPSDPEDSK